MTFTPVADYGALLAQATPRDAGRLLRAEDTAALKLSVQVAQKVQGASVWDSYGGGPGWDDAIWDDPEILQWVDVSDRVRVLDWDCGRTDPQAQPEAGVATVTLANLDGAISPWADAGDFVEGIDETTQASVFRPGTLMRFGVTDSTEAWSPWFAGRIESVSDVTLENVDAAVAVKLVDLLGTLAAYGHSLNLVATPDGLVGADMATRILADVSWPYELDLPGSGPLTTFTLIAPDPSQNRLEALRLIAASCDAFLVATAFNIGLQAEGDTSPLDVTLTNNPAGGNDAPMVDAVPYAGDDRLLNTVVGTRASEGGNPQTAKDKTSLYRHGLHANALGWPRTDLLNDNDADVKTLVASVVARQGGDYLGFSSLDLDADMRPADMYALMSSLALDGIQSQLSFDVRYVHPSGVTYTATVTVVGLHASLVPLDPGADDEGVGAKFEMTLYLVTTSATVGDI